MNQANQLQVGNLVTLPTLSSHDVWPQGPNQDLAEILRSMNWADLVITLARINLYIQRSEDILACNRLLKNKFCSRYLRHKIKRHGFDDHIIFNRSSTLRLLNESISIADPDSTPSPSKVIDVGTELGKCYLIANGLSTLKTVEVEEEVTDEKRQETMVELIPSLEYAMFTSPWDLIKKSLVRTDKLIARLQHSSVNFDANQTFHECSGLMLHEYQHLIYGILCVPLTFDPSRISEGTEGFIGTNPSAELTPMYEKLLQQAAIAIADLAQAARRTPSKPDAYLLWRKYPLLKISENKVICIDLGFLMDKLETGLFWILRNRLQEVQKGKEKEVFDLRGPVFQDYTGAIIQRGINSLTQTRQESCIICPKYEQKVEKECTDIAVYGHETLVLFECKASVLRTETKFSGDFNTFRKGIEDNALQGIEQLWTAIEALGHKDDENRETVDGIDISKVKKIYPVLLLYDRIFSIVFMNRYLNSEFKRIVKCQLLQKHLKVMPLTVLSVDNLEDFEPYLRDLPIHSHLDEWMRIFNNNESCPFSEYLRSLVRRSPHGNSYIEQEFKRIHANMMEFFSDRGLAR